MKVDIVISSIDACPSDEVETDNKILRLTPDHQRFGRVVDVLGGDDVDT